MRGVGVLWVVLLSSTAWADYRVTLVGATTALAPSGEALQLTGGGSFDPGAHAVRLSGEYVVRTSSGLEVQRGTWRAYSLERFTAWKHARDLGGVLEVMATLTSSTGKIDQQKMRFICTHWKPATVGEEEGVTFGPYAEAAGGLVRFEKE
jgi:hypothetical protein